MAMIRVLAAATNNMTSLILSRSFQIAKRSPNISLTCTRTLSDAREANLKYSDRYVCRLFLSGLCYHDLFRSTEMYMWSCSKVHSLRLRKEYEEARVKEIVNYDWALEDVLDRLLVHSRRRTSRVLRFLMKMKDARAATSISVAKVTQTPQVIQLSKQIKDKLKEADEFELEGKTDLKIRALEEVEELKTKRADKEAMLLFDAFSEVRASILQQLSKPLSLAHQPAHAPVAAETHGKPTSALWSWIPSWISLAGRSGRVSSAYYSTEQGIIDEAQKATRQEPCMDSRNYDAGNINIDDDMLRVCDICGEFLFVHSSGRQLADHFRGELHSGYMQIREKLIELQEKSSSWEESRFQKEKNKISLFDYYYYFDTKDPINYENEIVDPLRYRRHPKEPTDDLTYKFDAALSSSCPYEVYIFMGREYVLVRFAPDATDDKVLEGPFFICCGFRSLWCSTVVEYGIKCAFRCKDTSDAFLFSDSECIKINLAPHSKGGDSVIEDEKSIKEMFPCLKGTEFKSMLDAAFESLVDGEAYLFKGNRYALIGYGPDRKLIATGTITEAFPCLRNTIFENGISAAFTSHSSQEVYLFKEQYYARLSFTPGSTGGDRIIGGMKEILPNWSSLRDIMPRYIDGFDHDCINLNLLHDECFEELPYRNPSRIWCGET